MFWIRTEAAWMFDKFVNDMIRPAFTRKCRLDFVANNIFEQSATALDSDSLDNQCIYQIKGKVQIDDSAWRNFPNGGKLDQCKTVCYKFVSELSWAIFLIYKPCTHSSSETTFSSLKAIEHHTNTAIPQTFIIPKEKVIEFFALVI